MSEEGILEILELLSELKDEDCVPRNVRIRLENACIALQCQERPTSMNVDASLQELDEASENSNVSAYTKTQIYSIVSKLECIKQ
jgi:uncharacterized protein (UPF0147 family)